MTDTGYISLFDGKTLDGWKKADENPTSWKVEDGKLVCNGDICHLFYVGEEAPWKNFHFSAEVMTTPNSNAGIYFHTKYQATGWPKAGFECQVNVCSLGSEEDQLAVLGRQRGGSWRQGQ